MKNVRYFMVPQLNSVFKVTEDCCFEQVVYTGENVGVKGKIDMEGDYLNSYDFLCYSCNPNMKILPINEGLYFRLLKTVNELRA